MFYEREKFLLAAGGFLLAMLFDIGTSIVDALAFSYPWIGDVLNLYISFASGSVIGYPFGLAHESTTAILLAATGPSLITRIRRIY